MAAAVEAAEAAAQHERERERDMCVLKTEMSVMKAAFARCNFEENQVCSKLEASPARLEAVAGDAAECMEGGGDGGGRGFQASEHIKQAHSKFEGWEALADNSLAANSENSRPQVGGRKIAESGGARRGGGGGGGARFESWCAMTADTAAQTVGGGIGGCGVSGVGGGSGSNGKWLLKICALTASVVALSALALPWVDHMSDVLSSPRGERERGGGESTGRGGGAGAALTRSLTLLVCRDSYGTLLFAATSSLISDGEEASGGLQIAHAAACSTHTPKHTQFGPQAHTHK